MSAQDRVTPAHSVVITLAVLCAIAYSTWVILPRIDPELSIITAFVSEYAADGRPGAGLMRTGDAIAGEFMVAIAVLVAAPGPRWVRLTLSGGLMLAGAATIGDAMLPMECTPSLDVACAAAEKNSTVGLAHQLHSVTSSLVGIGIAAAVIASIIIWRRRAIAVSLAAGVLLSLALSAFNGVAGEPLALGIVQRISLAMVSLWLVVFTITPHTGEHRLQIERRRSAADADRAASAGQPEPAVLS
ncbi:DUF998 domain-containing protein [Brevibacterium otitidis]|uniref:DUF998 domain-containing protein n=1 Tax=Brevibacterium otitidis TaxID=53364 RepID=A0ABV5X2Y8_9MICO